MLGGAPCGRVGRAVEGGPREEQAGGGELGRGTGLGREKSGSRAEEKERERGLGRPGWVLGWVWFPFSILFLSSFLFLIQTKFEFKYKFEFKPHSIKSMHQHECNTKILNL